MSQIAWANHMTAALGVSDLERSIAWYHDVLGFELIYKLDDWGWAELRSPLAEVNVGIGQAEELEPRGGATLTFGVADIDAARAHLEAHDVGFDGETTEVPDRTIVDVARSGFALGERVLRPAQVIVARHPAGQP